VSDAPAPVEQAAEGDPVSSGQVESPPTQPEAPPPAPAEPDYLDITDDLRSKHVRVKVDGEEVSVPLDEALQGYQRQAAFTQHSQQLAEQRRQAEDAIRLHQAMQANPGLTVQVLAQHAGMSVEQYLGLSPQQRAIADGQQQQEKEPEFDDPLERELYQERQAREALERRFTAREADEQLGRAVHGLQQQYGLNDDQLRAVVATAMQMNLGIEYLPLVYQSMAFQAQYGAQQTAAQQRAAEEQQRQAAAANAASLIGNGTGAVGVTSTPANVEYSSYREAIAAAYDEVEARHR
jgi:hypothetical protein